VCTVKSVGHLILIIAGVLLSIVMIVSPIIVYGVNNVIFIIYSLIALCSFGAFIGLINKGALNNVMITEEGIYMRKFIRNNAFIKWSNVTSAETALISKFPMTMIAIEGHDECSQTEVTIYVENMKNKSDIIKQNLVKFKRV